MQLKIKDFKPRAYQEAIVETAKNKNCLVVLPTGLGKTACALLLAIERLNKFPSSKILFLAPTKPLASQHIETFKKHISGLDAEFMQLFTGQLAASKREKEWNGASIIFSTPQTIANDLRASRYSLEEVSLLIEDEAHRCLKNYDYKYLATEYKKQALHSRILALTASPGSDTSVIQEVCKNLGIEAVEVRTRESEDVVKYVKQLKIEVVRVDLPEKFQEIRNLIKQVYDKRIEELRNRSLVYEKQVTKKTLLQLQFKLRRMINSGNKHFNILRGISLLAEVMKLQHALELLETQSIHSLHNYIEEIFKQAEETNVKAVKSIAKNTSIVLARTKIQLLHSQGIEHPKIQKLKEILQSLKIKEGKKVIVFSQYRDNVSKINSELNQAGMNSRIFVGQTKKVSKGIETGMSQKEQQAILQDFKEGKINVLVATSIGEEGLDIPEVNAVIFYEPVPSAIRKIQRAGRTARLKSGKLIILLTRKTRDESYHYVARAKEKNMHGVLENLKESFDARNAKQEKQKKTQESLDRFL